MQETTLTAMELLQRARLFMASGAHENALRYFERARALEADNKDAHMGIGHACFALKRYDDSKRAYERVLFCDAQNGKALFALGNLSAQTGQAAEAVRYYGRAREAGFEHTLMYARMFAIYRDCGEWDAALAAVNRAIALSPMTSALYVGKLLLLLARNRLPEAEETLEDMRALFADSAVVAQMEARYLLSTGREEEALDRARAFAQREGNIRGIALYIEMLLTIESCENRVALAREQIARAKRQADYASFARVIQLFEARLALEERQLDTAEALLLQSFWQDDDVRNAELLQTLAILQISQKRYEKLLEYGASMERFAAQSAFAAGAGYCQAIALRGLGRPEEAERKFRDLTGHYRRVSLDNPKARDSYIYRALCHLALGEYDEALQLADYLIATASDLLDGRLLRHCALKGLARHEDMTGQAEGARAQNPLLDACLRNGEV